MQPQSFIIYYLLEGEQVLKCHAAVGAAVTSGSVPFLLGWACNMASVGLDRSTKRGSIFFLMHPA